MPPKTAPKGGKTVAQMRKKSEQKGCGGTRPEALNKLLEPLGDGTGRLGLACCVARGEIKYGSLRRMTEEKLGDYVSRGKAVYEHLGPKSKPHVDFVQRLEAEMKAKNQTQYFYSSKCHCHLDNVTSLLQRVEKKLSTAAPGAAQAVSAPRAEQAVSERAGGAEVAGGAKKRRIFCESKAKKEPNVEEPDTSVRVLTLRDGSGGAGASSLKSAVLPWWETSAGLAARRHRSLVLQNTPHGAFYKLRKP